MTFISQNPTTEEIFATFEELEARELEEKLSESQYAFLAWRKTPFSDRKNLFLRLASILREESESLGKIMTREMGKPIMASKAEIEKCAWVCEFYAENAEAMLTVEKIETDAKESFIQFEPLGMILAVMPWNFPFWQVFRFAAPALMAGNVGVLKHASNVSQCSLKIQELFIKVGFPKGVFQSLLLRSDKMKSLIEDDRIMAVTLTGSEKAGSQVASHAGRVIKKTVLELGGSDPFLVLSDADLKKAASVAVTARLQNAGQSCIAAKRFILEESIAGTFLEFFEEGFRSAVVGDPLDPKTQVGPLATKNILMDVSGQVEESEKAGAHILCGGRRKGSKGFFYEPTILTEVTQGMPAYHEEIFGPVASVITVKNIDEMIQITNDTSFGLGASLWTHNIPLAKDILSLIHSGSVFVNGMVKSDPRLPFGGIKHSGYGRELSSYGIKEFLNIKTVWIQEA